MASPRLLPWFQHWKEISSLITPGLVVHLVWSPQIQQEDQGLHTPTLSWPPPRTQQFGLYSQMKALWWGAGLDQTGRRWEDPLKLPGNQLELTVPWFSASSLPSAGFCCLSFHPGSQRPRSGLVSYSAEAASVSSRPAGSVARRLWTAAARRWRKLLGFLLPVTPGTLLCFSLDLSRANAGMILPIHHLPLVHSNN